ncbi:MAG: DUF1398 family protein [Saprospiraceae bacterium]|jgi:uncharacterized protein YbcV (DUF1398 family)
MFTTEQIHAAHSKVKSGADFPKYIRDLKQLGVIYYESFVADGHAGYFGESNYQTSSPPKYASLHISADPDPAAFIADLKAHQQGQTDYPTFCSDCAKSGIEKWVVDLRQMTCAYFDQEGCEVLVEEIPG